MKKLLFSLLTLAMLITLVACDNGGDDAVKTVEATEAITEALDATEVSTNENSTVAPSESTATAETTAATETTEAVATTEAVTTEEATTEEVTTAEPDVMIDVTLDAPYAEDFTVSKVFGSDMVVQRGERLRVWGWADESENGKKVSAEFIGMFSEAIIEDGKWTITFKARLDACADLGNTMKIYTDKKTVEFNDVLVGDVYMVIGQSNVAYKVSQHQDYYGNSAKGGADVLDYNAPIRIHYNTKYDSIWYPEKYPGYGSDGVSEDLPSGRKWERPDKQNLVNFTAIGYFFAHHVIEMNGYDVPVGIIEIDGNGNCLGTFMSNEVAESQGTDKYDETKGYYVTTGIGDDHGRYMYNNHIYPFRNYALAGIIWYQGESDSDPGNREKFATDFTALMTYMRSTHNVTNPNFPVYVMEFPSLTRSFDLGPIRAMAGQIPQMLENSYYCVSSDLWSDFTYKDCLHPHCKYEQGERLAKLAAAAHMNTMSLAEATGPIFESIEFSNDGKTAVIKFKNCGEGLTTCDGGVNVKGFVGIAKRSSSKVTVTATITGTDTITITSTTAINEVAYNCVSENFYGKEINLCNSYGNPAAAFWAKID